MEPDSALQMFLKSGFLKQEDITSIYRKEKFFSRKNDVYRIEVQSMTGVKNYVLKKYKGRDRRSRIRTELFFYDLLGGNELKVPGIYYSDREVVVMEYMGSRNLLDYIIQEENFARDKDIPGRKDYFEQLKHLAGAIRYIYGFNKRLKMLTGKSYVLNDMNHRNFLLYGGEVCRVDLEECREGIVEEDMGKFIAFFLTYDPPFTEWKRSAADSMKSFCRDIIDADISTIDREIKKELVRMAARRK
jgi:hypothetical protein